MTGRPQTLDVAIRVLNDKDGKDKTLKLVQYTSKLILWIGQRNSLATTFDYYEVAKRLSPVVSNLSTFRKIIRLGNWITTLRSMSKEGPEMLDWVDLYNEIFDDIYLLFRLRVLYTSNPKTTKMLELLADREANRAWLVAICMSLRSEYNKQMKLRSQVSEKSLGEKTMDFDTQERLRMSNINAAKLLCDFVFCTIDVFEFDTNPVVQIGTGLMSGILGYYKVFYKFSS